MTNYSDPEVQCQLKRQFAADKNMIVSGFNGDAYSYASPSTIMRPEVTLDGNMYCAITGPDIQVGICGFGKTAALALADYDRNFVKQSAPEPKPKA